MSMISTLTMLVGILVSILSGMICYLGGGPLNGQLTWVPCLDLLFVYPGTALGVGGFMILMGMVCHPSRLQ